MKSSDSFTVFTVKLRQLLGLAPESEKTEGKKVICSGFDVKYVLVEKSLHYVFLRHFHR